jgi:nucleotide-binding universal stress UspA family protein
MDRILVAYDGSEQSKRAARHAAELAAKLDGSVEVLVVGEFAAGGAAGVGIYESAAPVIDPGAYERLVHEGEEVVRAAGMQASGRIEWGSPADRIVAVAEEEGFTLVALGHRGSGGLETLLLGSVAMRVIDRVHCSVLIVR